MYPTRRPAPTAGTRIDQCSRCKEHFYRRDLEIRPDQPKDKKTRKFVCASCAEDIRAWTPKRVVPEEVRQLTFDDLQ